LVLDFDLILILPAVIGFIGALGLIRLPNIYTRIFASTMCSVGCTSFLILLLAARNFYSLLSMKYIILLMLILLTSPTASHAIANAAYKNKVDLKKKRGRKREKKVKKRFKDFIDSRLSAMEADE